MSNDFTIQLEYTGDLEFAFKYKDNNHQADELIKLASLVRKGDVEINAVSADCDVSNCSDAESLLEDIHREIDDDNLKETIQEYMVEHGNWEDEEE